MVVARIIQLHHLPNRAGSKLLDYTANAMDSALLSSIHDLLDWLALPGVGLPAIFLVGLVSATLLPLGSEPALFGYVQLAPGMFWPAVLMATAGNTLGGIISYAMGLGAHRAVERWRERHGDPATAPGMQTSAFRQRFAGRWNAHARAWLRRLGPSALLLSWLPAVGDPLCAVAGWLRLSFWPCVVYMAVGKLLRYVTMTAALLWAAGHWSW